MKKILSIFLIGILALNLFACKSIGNKKEKKEDASQNTTTYSAEEYDEVVDENDQLRKEIAIYDESYKTLGAFKKKSVLQAGKWTYNKISDKIVLNNFLIDEEDMDVEKIGLEASVDFGGIVSINTDSWNTKTNTSEVNVCIPEHAYGLIRLYKYKGDWEPEYTYDDFIRHFFDNNNITASKKRQIYCNNNQVGEEGYGTISIIDTTTNGQELTVPATSIIDIDQLEYWKLGEDSDVNIKVEIDGNKEVQATYRVGLCNVGGNMIQYDFLIYDNYGMTAADNLISNIKVRKNSLYVR